MRTILLGFAIGICLVAFTFAASAQQLCVCTAGCKIASDPYPPGLDQPTSCTVYKGGVQIGTGAVVDSSTIPVSNATTCLPSSAAYVPGPAGSKACFVQIPAQPANSLVTTTTTASNARGESGPSAPYSFQSVAALPVVPPTPTNTRAY